MTAVLALALCGQISPDFAALDVPPPGDFSAFASVCDCGGDASRCVCGGTCECPGCRAKAAPPKGERSPDCECPICECEDCPCGEITLPAGKSIVGFAPSWCAACPGAKRAAGFLVRWHDPEAEPALFERLHGRWKVRGWPSYVLVEDGEPVGAFNGVRSASRAWLERLLGLAPSKPVARYSLPVPAHARPENWPAGAFRPKPFPQRAVPADASLHTHRCDGCGHEWSHVVGSHHCSRCGRFNNVIHRWGR